MKDEKMDTEDDQFIEKVGNSGKWQFRIFFLCSIFCVPTAWHVLIMTFMNAKVDHWCARPESLKDMDPITWKSISGQTNQSCSVINRNWTLWTSDMDDTDEVYEMIPCTKWEYDTSEFTNTIKGDFDLVCENEYLLGMTQTLYFVGMILGVLTFGVLADIVGRKAVLVPLLICICLTGVATSLMPTFTLFATARIINAFFVIGIFETQFTYCIELVGGKWTTIFGMGMEYVWVAGWLSLAVFAYFIRNWRHLTLLISVPSILGLLMIWLVPESPRWLLAVNKLNRAEKTIRAAAKMNGRPVEDDWKPKPVQQEKKSKVNLLDLFKTRNMRMKILIIYYNFFVNAFLYFGLTFNIGDLGGDTFVNFAVSGLLEIPAYGLAMYVLLKCGRRIPYGTTLILSGLFLLSISFVPRGVYYKDWPAMALALTGKTCVTFSFGALFVYAAELVPTEIRTSAIGSASFLGRIGGIIAPWVGSLSDVHPYLPVGIFGVNAIAAGLISFFLPETQGKPLPYTIEEAEKLEMTNLLSKRQRKDPTDTQVKE